MILIGGNTMSNNSAAWSQTKVVDFFDEHRTKTEDVYPSEWFFLKDRLKENMSVLDIGCAQGGFAGIIGDQLINFSYTGLDISEEMIKRAKIRQPTQTFHHIHENDFSVLSGGGGFDMTLVLGILHLHETWRETIAVAWEYTSSTLLLDLRETFEKTIEDKSKSYFGMDINGVNADYSDVLPYNIINAGEALAEIYTNCHGASKISHFGYMQKPSNTTVTPIKDIFANVYCVEK